jgi:hypothetical protein
MTKTPMLVLLALLAVIAIAIGIYFTMMIKQKKETWFSRDRIYGEVWYAGVIRHWHIDI